MRVGLLDACSDRQLLGVTALHPRQRDLATAIERSRLVVACCGRRSGKTRTAAAAALHNLLLVEELDRMVNPGEPRYALSIANSREQARVFVDHARSLVLASPALRAELVSDNVFELVFRNDRILAAFPCSARTARGYAASFVLLDEAAHFYDESEGPAVASRVYAAMAPSVATFGEFGRVVVCSTPLGSDGLFFEMFGRAANGELPGAEAFHATTRAMNPAVDEAFLAEQELTLGRDDFQREYEAVFVAGGTAFIDADRLRDAVADRYELPPDGGRRWTAGLDPSFSRDATALAIVGRDPLDAGRLVLGWAGRWLPPRQRRKLLRSREEQAQVTDEILDGVADVLRRYGLRSVLTDQHLPGVVTHELGKRGISVRVVAWTPSSRTEALSALRARIHTGRLELYDPPGVPLLAELQRLRARYRAGSSTVETPRVGDSHSDVALALAAAVFEHDRYGLTLSRATISRPTGRMPMAGRIVPMGTSDGFDRLSALTGLQVTDGTRGPR